MTNPFGIKKKYSILTITPIVTTLTMNVCGDSIKILCPILVIRVLMHSAVCCRDKCVIRPLAASFTTRRSVLRCINVKTKSHNLSFSVLLYGTVLSIVTRFVSLAINCLKK